MDNFVAEILRNAPKGLRLYSPAFGMLNFVEVGDFDNMRDIITAELQEKGLTCKFYPNGKYAREGECQLFPSPTNRTWDNWQHFLLTYGNFITNTEGYRETLVISDVPDIAYDAKGNRARICIGAYRFATEDEKEAFLAELGRNGYEWDESSLEMRPTKTEQELETDDARLADTLATLYKKSLMLRIAISEFIKDRDGFMKVQDAFAEAETIQDADAVYDELVDGFSGYTDQRLSDNDSVTEYTIEDGWKPTLKKKALDWPPSEDKPERPEPLFNVGDWVTVKERQGDGSAYRCYYVDDMAKCAGKAYTIREAKNDRKSPTEGLLPDDGYLYTLEGDEVGWSWPSSALEPCDRCDSDNWSC